MSICSKMVCHKCMCDAVSDDRQHVLLEYSLYADLRHLNAF